MIDKLVIGKPVYFGDCIKESTDYVQDPENNEGYSN
jgi:hypothetical protein